MAQTVAVNDVLQKAMAEEHWKGGVGGRRGREVGGRGRWVKSGEGSQGDPRTRVGFQLPRRSSDAVSTSQDFDDKAAITAFCTQGGTAALRCCHPYMI